MGAEEAALKFSRRELTSSVFDFSRVGFRITSAPAVMMLPVERIHFVVILLYCFFLIVFLIVFLIAFLIFARGFDCLRGMRGGGLLFFGKSIGGRMRILGAGRLRKRIYS